MKEFVDLVDRCHNSFVVTMDDKLIVQKGWLNIDHTTERKNIINVCCKWLFIMLLEFYIFHTTLLTLVFVLLTLYRGYSWYRKDQAIRSMIELFHELLDLMETQHRQHDRIDDFYIAIMANLVDNEIILVEDGGHLSMSDIKLNFIISTLMADNVRLMDDIIESIPDNRFSPCNPSVHLQNAIAQRKQYERTRDLHSMMVQFHVFRWIEKQMISYFVLVMIIEVWNAAREGRNQYEVADKLYSYLSYIEKDVIFINSIEAEH